jgi:NAD(P)-dependent dehydrogenase (short-subunit alcohol dehydrogenase family)
MNTLTQKIALITDGSRGLGRNTAESLSSQGSFRQGCPSYQYRSRLENRAEQWNSTARNRAVEIYAPIKRGRGRSVWQ